NYYCQATAQRWEGEIVSIDRFGNLITSLPSHLVQKMNQPCLKIKRTKISNFLQAYCHGTTGELCVIVNSHGHLEISIPNGSAQAKLRADKKCRIWLLEASISPASQKSQ
ncbi:SAM-dependent chlorinase/fluorinase, partial [bacterium]|nr:SAM-dependent chlorinase/fluorinase [bacterium]